MTFNVTGAVNILFGLDPTLLKLAQGIADKLSTNQTQLDRIETTLAAITKGQTQMAADLAGIQQAVADETTVEQSAITLLTQLSAELAAAKNDPAAVQAILDSINKNKTDLAAAVAANTPASA